MIPQASIAQDTRGNVLPIQFDADGFLAEPENWTPALAERIALLEGISDLTAKHWEVIHHVRERYFSIRALPVMRLVCRAVGLDPNSAHKLFSSCRSLWVVAGLPNPGEEAKSYMN
ncbi:Sulfurtransferase [Burkholderiales bacterium]|nr:Sulfurtransferase [Burkholderiales bacterium]